jgi:hypothetical protein
MALANVGGSNEHPRKCASGGGACLYVCALGAKASGLGFVALNAAVAVAVGVGAGAASS